ncbi:uncharacterized protein METZ01_LOCUS144447 [marine metagenome]|uniref:Uncharacterized protein n=1 Tax=marine metagenome TaxID=408172 RepID=A0A381ZS48_9ZZZZ
MYRIMFPLKLILLSISLLITSCMMNVDEDEMDSLSIEWLDIDYNQNDTTLFLQVEFIPGNKMITEVFVEISSENFDSTIFLNDNGDFGDIIPQNNIFSSFSEIYLPFDDYQFNAVVQTSSLQEFIKGKNITIEEQYAPEIVDIIFWQKNADGSETMFDPNSEIFQVDDDEYNYLDFQLIINDKNGLDDIRYVRYQINIENMAAEDSCNYEPETGFLSYPQWFLEYKETTDAGFVFDVNNTYLQEPGIPIKPLNQCGRIGVSTFRFIVADMIFDPIIEDRFVGFDK